MGRVICVIPKMNATAKDGQRTIEACWNVHHFLARMFSVLPPFVTQEGLVEPYMFVLSMLGESRVNSIYIVFHVC